MAAHNPRELAPVAPELFVPDLAASVGFYTESLGFEALRVEPHFAVVALGEAIVMLAQESLPVVAPGAPRGLGIEVRIMVLDVDAVHQRLRENGVKLTRDIGDRDYGLRDFVVADPNGFRLRFASPLARLGP